VSPRRFKRRTYIIVASGRSALTFSAATSASSAWTTIRSALPFTLSPSNCQDILEPSKAELGGARPITPPAGSEDVYLVSLHPCWGAAQHAKHRERTGRKFRTSDRHLSERLSGRAARDRHRRYHGVTDTDRAFSFMRFLYRGLPLPLVFLWLSAHVSSPIKGDWRNRHG
jgi:hypothetical protein